MPDEDDIPATPRISDAEWTVMKVLWERGTSTLGDVVRDRDAVPYTHLTPPTIFTASLYVSSRYLT